MSVTCKNDDYSPTRTYRNDVLSLQQCCLDASDGVQTDCMPGYCPGSTMCENYMRDNCTTRFTNDINCKEWCIAHSGQCDAGAMDFCKTRVIESDKAFCGCINSLAVHSHIPAEPACVDMNCIQGGAYKTAAQENPDCPDESLFLPYSPAAANAAAASAAANAAAASAAANAAAATAGGGDMEASDAAAQKNIQILIWVVAFLLIISAVAYMLKRRVRRREPTHLPKHWGFGTVKFK